MDDHPHPRDMAASPLGWLSGDSLAAGRRFRQRRAAAEERRQVGAKAKRADHSGAPRPSQVFSDGTMGATHSGAGGPVSNGSSSIGCSRALGSNRHRDGDDTDAASVGVAAAASASVADAPAPAAVVTFPSAFSQVVHEACSYDDEDEHARTQRKRQSQMRDFALSVEKKLLEYFGMGGSTMMMGQLLSTLEKEPYGLRRHKPHLFSALREVQTWRNISSHPTGRELPSDAEMEPVLQLVLNLLLNSEDFSGKWAGLSEAAPPIQPLMARPLLSAQLPPHAPNPTLPRPPRPPYAPPPPALLPQSSQPPHAPSRLGHDLRYGVPPQLLQPPPSAPQHRGQHRGGQPHRW